MTKLFQKTNTSITILPMRSDQKSHSPSILPFVFTAALIFGSFYYLVIAMNTKDPLWFWPVFNQTPVEIRIYCYGIRSALYKDEVAFNIINNAMNESLTGMKRFDGLTMSRDTFNEYQSSEEMMTLHLVYSEPFRIHTNNYHFSGVTDLVVPLVGRHANRNPIFSLNSGYTGVGSLHVGFDGSAAL